MRASKHAQGMHIVFRAWLQDSAGGSQQGAGICASFCCQQEPFVPAASRLLSTSSTSCSAFDGFARVLREPVPKSVVFNRTNLKLWKRSRLNVGYASQLLQLQLQRGNPSDVEARKRASKLVHEAGSLNDLKNYVEHLGPCVAPGVLAGACAQAANIVQASVTVSASTKQPALDPKGTWPLLCSILQHLEPSLDKLSPKEMSTLLYGLSRLYYPLPGPTKGLIHQALAGFEFKEQDFRLFSSLMMSMATLNLHSFGGCQIWQKLSSSAAANAQQMDVAQISHVVQALSRSGDHKNRLWGPTIALISSNLPSWLQAQPDQLAAALNHVAQSGNRKAINVIGPLAVKVWSRNQAILQTLPARALVQLASMCAVTYHNQVPKHQSKPSRLLDSVCVAARQHVIRLTPHDLQALLTSLSLARKHTEPLVHLIADLLRIRGFAGLGPVPASVMLSSLADLGYSGRDLCRSVLPQALAALPTLSPAALANLSWAFAHMAHPQDAHKLVSEAAARLLVVSPAGGAVPASALARACVACRALRGPLNVVSDSGPVDGFDSVDGALSAQQQLEQQGLEAQQQALKQRQGPIQQAEQAQSQQAAQVQQANPEQQQAVPPQQQLKQPTQPLSPQQQRMTGLAAMLGKQLGNVKFLDARLEPGLAARLRAVMPELFAQ